MVQEIAVYDYYSETGDEKTSGSLMLKLSEVVAVYSLPKYRTRSMVITADNMKFCIKAKPEEVAAAFQVDSPLLVEGK
mgnify:CR=1 FL=1|tara:strand:+ start:161 stop:394 length:234 start_codon:yes stop_codon:yes gene_type:complete